MEDFQRTIVSVVVRICGVIICSLLLSFTPVTTKPDEFCYCVFIFILYVIICVVATLCNINNSEKSIGACIVSILAGLVLSIIAIYFGHLVCSGALFVSTIISVGFEYIYRNDDYDRYF